MLVWRIVEFLREATVETNSLHSISSVFFYRILFYSTLFFVVLHSSNSIILVFWFLLCWFKFSKNRINTRIIWNFIKIEISTLRKIREKFQFSIFHNFRKFSVKYFYLFFTFVFVFLLLFYHKLSQKTPINISHFSEDLSDYFDWNQISY